MKKLIRQILREEISGLTDAQIKSGYNLMTMITKGYYWYHDTPEQPFKHDEGSIWLINPDKKEWMLEMEKSGRLWFYHEIRDTFFRYMNMQNYDFELFINIWVEDVLKRRVSKTGTGINLRPMRVEDVLKKGVSRTLPLDFIRGDEVKDVLKNGKQMK
jgi:hypothetical protein